MCTACVHVHPQLPLELYRIQPYMEFFHLPWDIFSCDIIQADTDIACLAPRKVCPPPAFPGVRFLFPKMFQGAKFQRLALLYSATINTEIFFTLCSYVIILFLYFQDQQTRQIDTKEERFFFGLWTQRVQFIMVQ